MQATPIIEAVGKNVKFAGRSPPDYLLHACSQPRMWEQPYWMSCCCHWSNPLVFWIITSQTSSSYSKVPLRPPVSIHCISVETRTIRRMIPTGGDHVAPHFPCTRRRNQIESDRYTSVKDRRTPMAAWSTSIGQAWGYAPMTHRQQTPTPHCRFSPDYYSIWL